MGIPLYLAMSASEMGADAAQKAWLSCHFSPWSEGLSNLPTELPPGSLLILDDSSPIQGHDENRVFQELRETVALFGCAGLVLDFERAATEGAAQMAQRLHALPCPVYGPPQLQIEGPVFVPPVPILVPVEEYLQPWAGREILLDCCPAGIQITVTEKGSQTAPLPAGDISDFPHHDGELCCHYGIETADDKAIFRLRRTNSDIEELLTRAEKAGVKAAIGLWQEWHDPIS